MAILLTGGAGYIGSHTAVELLEAGRDIVIIDNFYNSHPCVLDRIREITGRSFGFYEADVADADAMERIFHENPIDSVIHFAGYKAVGESVQKPLAYYENNLMSTITLCRTMAAHNVKQIVFSSSATVYGKPDTCPIKETAPLSTTNPYGTTKLIIEGLLKDVWVSDPAWSVAILRYFNPIGAHPSGRIGEDPRDIPNNLLPYITQVAGGRRACLSVFGNDYDTHDGTGVRDYIHVVDLARAHLCALDYAAGHTGVEHFNVGTGTGYSVLDIVKAYEAATGVTIPYQITARRPGDIDTCYADPQKANDVLGWHAQYSIEDMCRHSHHWQQMNPNGYEN